MIAYASVVVLAAIFSLLPLRLALAVGRGLALFAFHVLRFRRRVVLANIAHTIGERMTDAERRALAAEAYRQFGMVIVEVLRSTRGGEDLIPNVIFGDLSEFAAARDRKEPLIILQPHQGNFDLAAYAFAAKGFPTDIVMRGIHNPRVHEMIAETRRRTGLTVIVKAPDSRDVLLESLEKGHWLGLCPDQNARERGVVVDWLGKPASIYKGPAVLHLRTGARIVVAVDERLADDPTKHRPHIRFLDLPARTGDPAKDTQAIMQACADAMCERIRLNPAQYFWFHRLWGKAVAGRG